MTQFDVMADFACNTGEGPLWHPDLDAVFWLDIPAGKIFRWDSFEGTATLVREGEPVGGMTLQPDGRLALFGARGNVTLWSVTGETETVIESLPDELESRFNDVIADPAGRVFCGTMPTPHRLGRLYRLDPDNSMQVVLEDVGCSNGMGFTPDGTKMYFTDSGRRTIDLFDYDVATGELSNRRLFVQVSGDGEGVPDGMTVDAEGNIWSTRWDGSCLVRYSPDGVETARFSFPIRKISCVLFGGPGYDQAFITTAGGGQKDADGEHAGALLRMTDFGFPVRGVAEFRSRL